jgi:glycosyltransferase involved in cell wall biosynthesis
VASRAGGIPEVVIDGETGALRAVGDIDDMAAVAIEILGDRARWMAMSTAAAADARRRFARDEMVARYEAFYARTLG